LTRKQLRFIAAHRTKTKKLRLLLGLWLREFGIPCKSLKELMDEIGNKAQARGLTPEILESLRNAT